MRSRSARASATHLASIASDTTTQPSCSSAPATWSTVASFGSAVETGVMLMAAPPRVAPGLVRIQREVPGNVGVGRVEVHLGLGGSAEATMAPAHFDVPAHEDIGGVGGVGAAADDRVPLDHRLAARSGLDVECAQLEVLPPVPRRRDAEPGEPLRGRTEHEVGRAAYAEQPPQH